MDRVWNTENSFFRFMGKIGDIFLLNVMWVVCSLPIVTMGAATTAAMYVGMKLARGEDGLVVSRFMKSFKMNFKQATIIHLIMLPIGIVLAMDVSILLEARDNASYILLAITTIVVLVYVVMLWYVYAVLARFDNSVKGTFKNAFFISLVNFPINLLMLVGLVVYVVLNCMALIFNAVTLFFGLGALAYFYGILFNFAFRKFIPKSVKEEIRETTYAVSASDVIRAAGIESVSTEREALESAEKKEAASAAGNTETDENTGMEQKAEVKECLKAGEESDGTLEEY